jgi:regulatory protein YycI of two-component signal transduction system YycFG
MDWSKAKTILIAALIITDVILIFTYGNFGSESGGFSDNKALAGFLAQKNIYVDADMIPADHEAMPVLYVENEDADDGKLGEALAQQGFPAVDEDKEAEYRKIADSFIKAAGQAYETAVFDRIERNGEYTRVIYKNVIKGAVKIKSAMIFL